MKNAFDGLISRLDTAEKRIFELEAISIEISFTGIQESNSPSSPALIVLTTA